VPLDIRVGDRSHWGPGSNFDNKRRVVGNHDTQPVGDMLQPRDKGQNTSKKGVVDNHDTLKVGEERHRRVVDSVHVTAIGKKTKNRLLRSGAREESRVPG